MCSRNGLALLTYCHTHHLRITCCLPSSTIIVLYFLFVYFLFMIPIPRRNLERLCKSDVINQSRSDTVYGVLKDVPDRLFTELSTRIFQHADQHGRHTILRALSLSAAHLELDKLFCPVQDEDVNKIHRILAVIEFKREKENRDGEDVRTAQEALWRAMDDPLSLPEVVSGSPTPDPVEMRIAKWISDQNNLPPEHDRPSEHVKNRKRRHSDIASDECNSSHVGNAFPEMELQERVVTRQQPKRSCKGTRETQGARRCGERELRTRKTARSEAPQRSTRGISKPTIRSGNIGLRRMCSDKKSTTLKDRT